MEIQMRKIQAAQRVPCLNIWVDVQFILARVCYTFVELGNYMVSNWIFGPALREEGSLRFSVS
jgi:hypothetical protein